MENTNKRFNPRVAKEIGDKLRNIRHTLGADTFLTQADLADGAGVSLRQYAYIENGQRIPSFQVMCRIARNVYNMAPSEFVKHFDNIDFE